MKKTTIFVLFIFVFCLTGCTDSPGQILEILKDDIVTCKKSCVTDAVFDDYIDLYYADAIEAYKLSVTPNKNEEILELTLGQMYTRDQIPHTDLNSGNWDIPFYYPYTQFDTILNVISDWISDYSPEATEQNESFNSSYSSVIDSDYGFDDHSGYLKIDAIKTDGNEIIRECKFNLDSKNLGFEMFTYDVEKGSFAYTFMKNNIYKRYIYYPGKDWFFTYINLSTKKYLSYQNNFQGKVIKIYDPDEEILYESNIRTEGSMIKVTKYQDMEMISSAYYIMSQNFEFINEEVVAHPTEVYYSHISLFAMSGWDALLWRSENYSENNYVYLNDVRVFDDLLIVVSTDWNEYYNAFTYIQLEESDLNDYHYPDEFTGDVTFEFMKEKLNLFKNLEDPLVVARLYEDRVLDKFIEISNTFSNRYS